jgi:hypothetical protein
MEDPDEGITTLKDGNRPPADNREPDQVSISQEQRHASNAEAHLCREVNHHPPEGELRRIGMAKANTHEEWIVAERPLVEVGKHAEAAGHKVDPRENG